MKILNSNREGHLAAAIACGAGSLIAALVLQSPNLALTAITIPVWELVASCDMDIDTRSPRKGNLIRRLWVMWWKPYAKLVDHRSRYSHSLLLGTSMRLVFGPIWWLVFLVWLPGPQSQIIAQLWVEKWPWFLSGMLLADTVHMLKDGFGLKKIIFGN